MNILMALAVGYLVGAKTGGEDLDRLGRSLKALCQTDEFADVLAAGRAQLGHTLHTLAAIVEGESGPVPAEPTGDLVARVRHLVGRESPAARPAP
jgi:hypothetical protein